MYTFLGELLRAFPSIVQYRMAISSLLLLVVIIVLPMGVLRARPRKSRTDVDEAIAGQEYAPLVALKAEPVAVGAGTGDLAAALQGAHLAAGPQVVSGGAGPDVACTPRATGQVLLSVKGVSKNFGGIVAVDDVSFDVHEGEILGVIGPNGAGKTTLFNLITGIYKPDRGTVTYKGEDITGLSPDRVAVRVWRAPSRTFACIRNCRCSTT